jgi:DNA polymerase-3 subunit beta
MPHPETQVSAEKTAAKSEKKPVKPTAHFAALHSEITEALNIAEFGVPAQAQPVAQRGVLIETSRNRLTLSTFDFWTAVSVTVPVGTPVAKGYSLLDFAELKRRSP